MRTLTWLKIDELDSQEEYLAMKVNSLLNIPYPRERGSMGGAPYIGPRLGEGPIFFVSVSHIDVKERPDKLPTSTVTNRGR